MDGEPLSLITFGCRPCDRIIKPALPSAWCAGQILEWAKTGVGEAVSKLYYIPPYLGDLTDEGNWWRVGDWVVSSEGCCREKCDLLSFIWGDLADRDWTFRSPQTTMSFPKCSSESPASLSRMTRRSLPVFRTPRPMWPLMLQRQLLSRPCPRRSKDSPCRRDGRSWILLVRVALIATDISTTSENSCMANSSSQRCRSALP